MTEFATTCRLLWWSQLQEMWRSF